MYLKSHAGVLDAGRDLGWREFSLVVCQLLGDVNRLSSLAQAT
jgi:hypothetical protein